jgi:His/Glu/Gln/Arg/opine family amino acid ABC transporter permease subunit
MFYQVLFVAVVVAFGWFLVHNTLVNLGRQNIATGFGFLGREASFAIGESLIAYAPSDTYARAFLVGLVNTLYVAVLGIVLATILGTVIGIARLSRNWLIAKLSLVYVETFRNIPLPLQLLFWWTFLREGAPSPRQAWRPLPGVFVSDRGVEFPMPQSNPAHLWMFLALVLGLVVAIAVSRWARRRQMATGAQFPSGWVGIGLTVGLPLLVFLAAGVRLAGAEGVQLRRRRCGLAGIRGVAIRADDLHRELYRRDRTSRHFISQLGTERGGLGARPSTGADDAARRIAAGATRHHSTDDQSVSEPDQKQLARRDHWLPRSRLDRQHDDEPDWSGGRRHRADHGGLSGDQLDHCAVDEPL